MKNTVFTRLRFKYVGRWIEAPRFAHPRVTRSWGGEAHLHLLRVPRGCSTSPSLLWRNKLQRSSAALQSFITCDVDNVFLLEGFAIGLVGSVVRCLVWGGFTPKCMLLGTSPDRTVVLQVRCLRTLVSCTIPSLVFAEPCLFATVGRSSGKTKLVNQMRLPFCRVFRYYSKAEH